MDEYIVFVDSIEFHLQEQPYNVHVDSCKKNRTENDSLFHVVLFNQIWERAL